MSEPDSTATPSVVEDLAKTAVPTPDDSLSADRDGQGSQDTGGLLPPDHAEDVQPPA